MTIPKRGQRAGNWLAYFWIPLVIFGPAIVCYILLWGLDWPETFRPQLQKLHRLTATSASIYGALVWYEHKRRTPVKPGMSRMPKWFALHPFPIWLALLVTDIFVLRWFYVSAPPDEGDPEMAGWETLAWVSVIFGTLCLRFPRLLGNMEGPVGRGGWLHPTPAGLVTAIGWGFMAVPVLLIVVIALFDGRGS